MNIFEEWNLVQNLVIAYECHKDVFLLEGENSKQWCNGIFTNNIRSMEYPQYKKNAYCNDRGHVQGIATLLCIDTNSFLCVLESPKIEDFLQRFSMFMVLDDIENTPKNTKIISIQGREHASYFEKISQDLEITFPSHETYGHNPEKNIFCTLHDRSGFGGIDIITTNPDRYDQVLTCLQTHNIARGTPEGLESLRIGSNQVCLQIDAPEKHFVHELRINEECCAFDKGCYVGQEIINRMDVKGILNKRLTRIVLEDTIDIPSEVFLDTNLEKSIGKLTSVAQTPMGFLGLAILRKEAWTHQQKLIIKNDHQTVQASVFEPEKPEDDTP